MAFTNRYVTVSGAGARNGTSEANAWTIDEALAGYTAGHRVYVKGGTHTATATSNIVNLTRSGQSGTRTAPVVWEGYTTTPGDLAPGGMPVIYCNNAKFNMDSGTVGVWSMRRVKILGNRDYTVGIGEGETPLFRDCAIENAASNSGYPGDAISCSSVGGVRAVNTLFKTANTLSSTKPWCANNVWWGTFVGCLFDAAGHGVYMDSPVGGLLQRCVFKKSVDLGAAQMAIKVVSAQSSRKVLSDNTIIDFGWAIAYDCHEETPIITNNVIVRSAVAMTFKYIPTGLTNTTAVPVFVGNAKVDGTGRPNSTPDFTDDQITSMGGWIDLAASPVDANGVLQQSASSQKCLTDGIFAALSETIGAYGASDWPTAANMRSGVVAKHGLLTGTITVPTAANVRHGTAVDTTTGTCRVPVAGDVRHGTLVDATTGTCRVPTAANVRSGTLVDATTGTLAVPIAGNVRHGTAVDATTGTCRVPVAGDVRHGTLVDATTGTLVVPGAANVRFGTTVDGGTGTCKVPAAGDVRFGTAVDATTGTCRVPTAANTRFGIAVDATTGTLAVPAVTDVRYGTLVDGSTGTCKVPTAGNVRHGTAVDATTGTLAVPAESDVRSGVDVDNGEGTCAVPVPGDVRLGVAVDDTEGTLVIEGGAEPVELVFTDLSTTEPDEYDPPELPESGVDGALIINLEA